LKRTSKAANLHRLRTEQTNSAAADLDRKSSLEIARLINQEDASVAAAVKRALPQIARAIDHIAAALRKGGRLIYVGAGTSGRIAALDASECGPTGKNDVVVGIASSGRTPFTVAAVEYARRHGARTIALTCNRNSQLERVADFAIVTEVGPEVLAGSSRMKAGTAHKMVLNMLSTGAMTRLGYVYGNLMVNVLPRNEKLIQRAIGILERVSGVDRETARRSLAAAGNRTPVALVMLAAGVTRAQASTALKTSGGHVRRATALAKRM
jgi:N-acetylmuramic acid 6-phosphate etherase